MSIREMAYVHENTIYYITDYIISPFINIIQSNFFIHNHSIHQINDIGFLSKRLLSKPICNLKGNVVYFSFYNIMLYRKEQRVVLNMGFGW